MPIFLLLGVLAIAGLALAHGGSTPTVDTTGIPAALVKQINAAVDSADPVLMRKTAATVRQSGFPVAANSLEAAALAVEQAMADTPATRAGLPKVNPAPKADNAAARALAGRLAQLLSGQSLAEARGSADVKSLVTAFEAQEKARGFYVGNIDGIYGPKAALALAKDHGIVPPHPLYWPKKDPNAAKQAYKVALSAYVAADPQRAEEWTQALNVDSD